MPIARFDPGYDLQDERLQRLRELFPEAFADGELDWDALRDVLGAPLEEGDEYNTYGLFWPGKRAARQAAAIPPRDALAPAPGEGVDEEATRNVFVEGDNLEVLKLLRKAYAGRVKLIYIDPPYNTGNDFVYRDDLSEREEDYLRRTGQMDDLGQRLTTNTSGGGRLHSNWFDMMYPRLVLAKELLAANGIMFISIDDGEVSGLRQLCNEVFGQENFFAQIPWQSRTSVQNDTDLSVQHEYLVCYAKVRRQEHRRLKTSNADLWYDWPGFAAYPLQTDDSRYSNPDNDSRGPWKADPFDAPNIRPNLTYAITNPITGVEYWPPQGRHWRVEETKYLELVADRRIVFGRTGSSRPQLKVFLSDMAQLGEVPNSWFEGGMYGTVTSATKEMQRLFDGVSPFTFPKPTRLIKALLALSTRGEDLVLDFFAGSCTTADAVLQQNRADGGARRHIMVQIAEPTPEGSIAHQSGYNTIAEIGKERIRRVTARMQEEGANAERETPEDLGFRVFRQGPSNLKRWRDYAGQSVSEYQSALAGFTTPLVEGWDPVGLRTEVMLAQGFPLDSRIERCTTLPHNAVEIISHEWCEHRLWICLDARIAPATVEALPAAASGYRPQDVFVCLDSALSDEGRARLDDRANVVII